MDIQELQMTLRRFAAERNWEAFHTPKNLAMALMVEAAELQEIFQWMTPEQSETAHQDAVTQQHIGDEVADVLLYLLQLADHSRIDLGRAVSRKIVKNANKYPPVNSLIPSGKGASPSVPIHVLIDWENVQPKESDILKLVPGATDIWVFHGQNQKLAIAQFASFGDKATLVPITRPGKNALDFHLSFYMGYIASRTQDARIVVMSNDKGYGPMLEHAVDLGFSASQLGFAHPKANAKKATSPKPMDATPTGPTLKPAPPKKVITSTATTPAPQKAAAATPKKVANTKPSVTPPAAKKSPATKTVTPAQAANPAKKSAIQPTPTAKKAAKPTAQPATADKQAISDGPASSQPNTPQTKKSSAAKKVKRAPQTIEDRAQLVLSNLKNSTKRPSRKARLLGTIQSLINVPKEDPQINTVLQSLLRTGEVMLSDSGAVTYK